MKGELAEGNGLVPPGARGQGQWGESERACPRGHTFIPCPSPSQISGDPKQTSPTPASHPGELSSLGVAPGGTFSGLCGAGRPRDSPPQGAMRAQSHPSSPAVLAGFVPVASTEGLQHLSC